jgi:hypothetical protein
MTDQEPDAAQLLGDTASCAGCARASAVSVPAVVVNAAQLMPASQLELDAIPELGGIAIVAGRTGVVWQHQSMARPSRSRLLIASLAFSVTS